ncbi:MAG: hypothetical protein GY845_16745 [Planctomycetes bacterium]|nr:hypothetical protein [Planctomycetota bacterium]
MTEFATLAWKINNSGSHMCMIATETSAHIISIHDVLRMNAFTDNPDTAPGEVLLKVVLKSGEKVEYICHVTYVIKMMEMLDKDKGGDQ